MTRRRLALGAALLGVVLLALLVLGRPSTGDPVDRTPVAVAEVGGPAARPAASAPVPPARSVAAPQVEEVPPPRAHPVPSAAEHPEDAADGRIEGPTDTDPPTYTLDGVGVQAAFDDVREDREACLDELPEAPPTPATLAATLQVVDVGGEGRVDAVYLPVTHDEDGPLIACLARTMVGVRFERPRRERVGLTATWTLKAP